MNVVILAGGLGTRLAEETEVKPKPMVEIGGRPILWHIMKHYAHHGFDDFTIALGYKGMWVIESCFRKMKTTGLEVRPMFHWMPHRITAHVKLCVLALMIQRAAEIATGLPWRQLAGMLERLKAVRYTSEGRTFVQATTVSPELAEVLKKLDVPAPKTILAVG